MVLWIVYYKSHAKKNMHFIDSVIDAGKALGMNITLKYADDIISNISDLNKNMPNKPDGVIARMINPKLSLIFESLGIKVFNNYNISYVCNNKALTYIAVNKLGITHIPSIVVSSNKDNNSELKQNKYVIRNIYSMKDSLYSSKLNEISISFIEDLLYRKNNSIKLLSDKYNNISLTDYVIKSVTGHGGQEVMTLNEFLISDKVYGEQEFDASGYYNEKYVIQPLIETGTRDLRVYVIGKIIIGAVLRESVIGFKSNYSLGGNVRLYTLDECQKNIVYKIINAFDFSYVGIDFLLTSDDKLIFNEIEDVVGARMLSECTNIDYVNMFINYIAHNLE